MEQIIIPPKEIIEELILESRKNPRKRILRMIRSSDSSKDVPAVMINVMQPGTYAAPHKHPGSEVWIIYQGKLNPLIFDEDGSLIKEKCPELFHEGKPLIIIPKGVYHSLLVREKDTVLIELYGEVYEPSTYRKFADWAPEEVFEGKETWTQEKQNEMNSYQKKLIEQINSNENNFIL